MRAHTAHDSTWTATPLTIYASFVRSSGAVEVLASTLGTRGTECTFSHVNFINNTGRGRSSALSAMLATLGGDYQPAVMSNVTFAGNVGTGDRPLATYNSAATVWHCRRGSWMPTSGALYGDFSAPTACAT